jgi:ribosomal protein S18 acetylase RimI-like enzyme
VWPVQAQYVQHDHGGEGAHREGRPYRLLHHDHDDVLSRSGEGQTTRGLVALFTTMGTSYSVRPAVPADTASAYRICLRTGADGADATDRYRDPELLGHLYLGAYLSLAPEFAFILADENDQPVGYTVGVPDTLAFERRCELHWWPRLRDRYPIGSGDDADADLIRQLHAPYRTDVALATRYPAHLHIDLLPQAQGQGHGRRLMDRLLGALAAAGAAGVHLGVSAANTGAVAFYQRLGFTEYRRHHGAITFARDLP